jgi:hypothetical protein
MRKPGTASRQIVKSPATSQRFEFAITTPRVPYPRRASRYVNGRKIFVPRCYHAGFAGFGGVDDSERLPKEVKAYA